MHARARVVPKAPAAVLTSQHMHAQHRLHVPAPVGPPRSLPPAAALAGPTPVAGRRLLRPERACAAAAPRAAAAAGAAAQTSSSKVLCHDDELPIPVVAAEAVPALLSWCGPSALPAAAQVVAEEHLSPDAAQAVLLAALPAAAGGNGSTAGRITARHLLLALLGAAADGYQAAAAAAATSNDDGAAAPSGSVVVRELRNLLACHGAPLERVARWAQAGQQQQQGRAAAPTMQGAAEPAAVTTLMPSLFSACAQHLLVESYRWALYTGGAGRPGRLAGWQCC